MNDHCLKCGRSIHVACDSVHSYTPQPPADVAHHVATLTCPSCQACHTVSSRSDSAVSWLSEDETLLEGRDYVWGQANKRFPLDGRQHLRVYWAWLPMYDDGKMGKLLLDAIKGDRDLRLRDTEHLLVMSIDHFIPSLTSVMISFDGCMLLKSHVMAGAEGPYPSVRAERSLVKTTLACKPRMRHYWPSATLPVGDYAPLTTDAELRKAWTRYSRQNLMAA